MEVAIDEDVIEKKSQSTYAEAVAPPLNEKDDSTIQGSHLEYQANSSDNEDSRSGGDSIDRKRRKVLSRMMPAFMVGRLVQGRDGPQKRLPKQRSVTTFSDSDDESSVLPPGQTRKRLVRYPKEVGEIKGDTESSDDQRSSIAGSSNDPDEPVRIQSKMGMSRRPIKHPITNTLELYGSDDHSGSDSGVDDDEIQAYFVENTNSKRPGSIRQRREESLIDWMLAKTRTVGVPQKRKIRKTRPNNGHKRPVDSSRYNIDVTTRAGLDRTHQTRLKFDRPPKNPYHRNDEPHPGSTSRLSVSDLDVGDDDDLGSGAAVTFDYRPSREKSRKEREKERRARAKTNGLYTFASSDTHVITGRRETRMVTLDLEDEGFHLALAPSQDLAKFPPRQAAKKETRSSDQLSIKHYYGNTVKKADLRQPPQDRKRRRDIRGDFDIPLFHSGLSFDPNTYMGKGWLHELISIVSSNAVAPEPPAISLRGMELGPSMDIEAFLKSLKGTLDRQFELTTGLATPDSADEAREWAMIMRVMCQLLSWFLATASEVHCRILREAAGRDISKLVSQMRELSLGADSMDIAAFSLCWFAVELSARLGGMIPNPICNALGESVMFLIHNLVEYGTSRVMDSVRNGSPLSCLTTAQYNAGLWICLFHLLDTYHSMNPGKLHMHPFWHVLKESLESASLSKSNLEASEMIWSTIYSLCALTQFSVHGMTTATSRLPPCWDLVVVALKRIRLTIDPISDRAMSDQSLDKRDEYIGLIVIRCFHLWNRWNWHLEQASVLFNQLVEIFRSRKFANLRHERPDYPQFVLNSNWELLSSYEHRDSAFGLFLKLMVQAAGCDDTNPNRTLSPKGKKLLSLAIPVGCLPFSKDSPPALQDIAMLYNRLSAVAIGIYLDPAHHASRITHARTYVRFSEADDTTRLAVIRGVMNLGILLKKGSIPLDAIFEWIQDIAAIFVAEFKSMPRDIVSINKQPQVARDRLFLYISTLIGTVRRIAGAYKVNSDYPDPTLLSKSASGWSHNNLMGSIRQPISNSFQCISDKRTPDI